MLRLKPPLAFFLSRLIRAGLLILSLVSMLIPTRAALADNQPPPILPGGWRTFTTANAPIALGAVNKIFEDSQGRVWIGTSRGVSMYKDGVWQTFTAKEDGLAEGYVTTIIEDHSGQVWVGTPGGISVYTGRVWQTFTEKNGLAIGGANTIMEDHAGRVWVGSWSGVSAYVDGTWQLFTEKDGLATGEVVTIIEDHTGQVWVGMNDFMWGTGGVSVYTRGSWQTFTEKDGLMTGGVETIVEDHAGRVWIGIADHGKWTGGISLYTEGSWQTFSEKDGLAAGFVQTILQDRAGRVWVGTSGGVSVYAGGTWQTFTEGDGLAGSAVSAIIEDRAGRMWIGTSSGISVYTKETWQTFAKKDGLELGQVNTIIEDRTGQVWVGTGQFIGSVWSGGISVYVGDAWRTFTDKDGLSAGVVNTIVEDRVGRVWVGTSTIPSDHGYLEVHAGGSWKALTGKGNVSMYAGEEWLTFTESDTLSVGSVLAVLGDHAGRVWIGTSQGIGSMRSGGVSLYMDGAWQTFTDRDGLAAGYVTTLAEDHARRVWVGTQDGVSVYAGGVWQTFTEKDGLAAGYVAVIVEDRAGRVWVGTQDGVSVYAGEMWRTFTEKDGLAVGAVRTIIEDHTGRVWVGTGTYTGGKWTGGVSVYTSGVWQTFTEKDGLTKGEVTAILEDHAGLIWVGTDGGVSVYTHGMWQTFSAEDGLTAGSVQTMIEDHIGRVWVGTGDYMGDAGGVSIYTGGVWQTFTEKDGLTKGKVTAILEDHAERVWVGTHSGVSMRPRSSRPPWVFVQACSAEGQAAVYNVSKPKSNQQISFVPDNYQLRIDFSGSDMDSRQDNVFFRYQLEGHEQEWHTTKAHEAQYTNVPPGDYTFVVKSVDEDALESPPATLQIRIERFWWQSPVAWAGGVAGLGLLTFGAVLGARGLRRKRQLDAWRKGHDPYIVGAVIEEPDKFYGREETLTELIHALEAGNHMALYGERRIGKTSLLHQLAHRLEQTKAFIPVFVEMQVVSEDNFFLALMSAIAKAIRARADIGSLTADKQPAPYKAWDMASDLDIVFDALRQKGDESSRIVLLLDEADKMNHYDPHIQEALRGLLMHAGERISLVWSGQTMNREWKLDTSPWYNLFKREIHLAGIDQAAADRLIRQPVKGVYEYDDDAVERIFQYSDYEPYRIQRLCSACVRRLLDAGRDRVTVEDVEAAYQALVAKDGRPSSESSAPVSYQVSSPASQAAEKKADYHKDADQ
jgi:ligand-binding sensor domain-containing protein/DNA polymerase III delta prime subunit